MRKIIIKITIVMMIIMLVNIIYMSKISCVLSVGSVVVNDGGGSTPSGKFNPNDYEPDSRTTVSNANELEKIGNRFMGVLMTIGTVLSVVVLMGIGVKYMMGSVEEKAQYKKTLFPYVVGASLVFGITTIIQILSGVAQNI